MLRRSSSRKPTASTNRSLGVGSDVVNGSAMDTAERVGGVVAVECLGIELVEPGVVLQQEGFGVGIKQSPETPCIDGAYGGGRAISALHVFDSVLRHCGKRGPVAPWIRMD